MFYDLMKVIVSTFKRRDWSYNLVFTMARLWTTNPMAREVSSSIQMTSEVGKYLRALGSMVAEMDQAR